ncbi:hypothetical protein [Paenibacillus sp. MMS20-IR301]|uniref:hypothetical protein n=1 Tax=Paenibacillus sp. MMS20-IR301 TaxID=2895946 RepID=UPI0028E7C362|nr:hypothetical protein [Paenibacillus sp. MMS20-IR301]WNS41746.1 hypothetical protein LOS79_22375 [Paenibacillus sp. MMS20-IR301]
MPVDKHKRYFVSVNHGLVQDMPSGEHEFEVLLSGEELNVLQDLLKELASSDDFAFRRAFIPYKSADHDSAAGQFDDATLRIFQYLHGHGTDETRQLIEALGVLPKLGNTGYQDEGYGPGGSVPKDSGD